MFCGGCRDARAFASYCSRFILGPFDFGNVCPRPRQRRAQCFSEISSESYRAPNPRFRQFSAAEFAPRPSPSMAGEPVTPAAELFAGYSYLRFNPRVNGTARHLIIKAARHPLPAMSIDGWDWLPTSAFTTSAAIFSPVPAVKLIHIFLVRASLIVVNGGRPSPPHCLARHA